MIILDLNQVMISNIMMQLGNHTNTTIEEGLVRHMVLNTIRSLNSKYRAEYGEMVIACDDKRYWRKSIFPHYKANRKKVREESELDWTAIFQSLNRIREELREYFPYRVIQVDGAEADDVIASLVFEYGVQLNNGKDKILILSGDKDFIQLHGYANVTQFDPIRKKAIEHPQPGEYLKEHILNGDRGDGIPNVLSADDCLVRGERQKKMTAKRLAELSGATLEELPEPIRNNVLRNKTLIDLRSLPPQLGEAVVQEYHKQAGKGREKLFNYFVANKLNLLMEHINEF